MLTAVDTDVLAQYCEVFAEVLQATHDIQEQGTLYYTAENGYQQASAAVSVRRNAIKLLSTLGNQLGLSPGSRAGLKVEKPPEVKKGAKYFGS